jgi:DnaJ like chaperone protein
MGFVGKIVGGTIGFAIGGPLGALAGAVFGHTFDQPEERTSLFDAGVGPEGGEARAQLTFFVGTFSMLAKLARCDGRITSQEVDAVERFMADDLGLDPESRRAARGIFNKAVDSGESFLDYASQFYQQFQGEPHLLEMMIDIMLRVSVSDGRLSDTEESLILSAVRMFRLSEEGYEKIRSRYQGDALGKYYSILGAAPADSDEKIKQQYRKLVSEYHPDKISSKGLPEPFIQFANEKFREVQDAYEKIRSRRKMK